MHLKTKYLLSLILFFSVLESNSQDTGRPFIRNFTPREYGASQQDWAIAQDLRGVMYFANNDGLLEFDGVSWRLIKLPGVRSIVIDSAGRIYVGLENDMGYLEPDNTGNYKYCSLKTLIPGEVKDITPVYTVYKMGDQVIFQADDKIYIYQDERIKVLLPRINFYKSYVAQNRYYAMELGSGFYYLKNDSLAFIEGSELFASERISSMLPYGTDEILIVTRTRGLYIYSPDSPEVFHKPECFKEVDEFLVKNQTYNGTVLPEGDFAIGSITGGIIVFDANGMIKDLYYKSAGLQDNTVLYLYSDQNRQLWVTMDIGISLIQNNLPFRNYTDLNGLFGSPMCLKFFDDRFYVGTGQYLHIQNRKGNFEPIAGTESQNFCLFEVNGILLLGRNPGLYEIIGKKAILMENTSDLTFLSFASLKNHPEYLLAGEGNGLFLLEYRNSKWVLKHQIKGFDKSAYEICVDKNKNIWISTVVDLFRLNISNDLDNILSLQKCTVINGLPSNYGWPFILNTGEVVFGSEKGIYRYIDEKDWFEPHPDFTMIKGKVLPFRQEKNGDIWFDEKVETGKHERGVLKYRNGKYVLYKTPFYKFGDLDSGDSPNNMCSAPDSTIFFGTSSGLIQYNPKLKFNTDRAFHTLIRQVYSKDSLLFGGKQLVISDFIKIKDQKIPYKQHDMIFHFAAAFYEDAEKNLYSYRLIGSDTSWSAWVSDHKKEYTNLHEGEYTFEVRSKNQYQKIGSTASYSFTILPPWHRTWWAYGLYAILSTSLIWQIVKFNIRRLVKQKEHLELVVKERTAELKQTNSELTTALDIVRVQKTDIETAHQQITDSIHYAQRIQKAVLPSSEMMSQSLPEHFVLFKPCDVVSGDFYWYAKIKNQIILTVVDCTGHGVPGALMSMLGMSMLKEIVLKENITRPDVILKQLRKEIIKALGQTGALGEQIDGMDISLCSINTETLEMQWAGAINPCLITREGGLIKLEADKMPIAYSDKMDKFTLNVMKLQKNDTIYLASDGFVDQLGGPDHKRFMSTRFKELLLTISDRSISEQKEILDKTLEKWRNHDGKKYEQTDDITVLGLKI